LSRCTAQYSQNTSEALPKNELQTDLAAQL
jgi:hypothetical protein